MFSESSAVGGLGSFGGREWKPHHRQKGSGLGADAVGPTPPSPQASEGLGKR